MPLGPHSPLYRETIMRQNEHNPARNGRAGFTLIELLVVISMIALLTSILMPSLSSTRELAQSAACLSNLRCLGSSMAMYHTENEEHFWPYRGSSPGVGAWFFWGAPTLPVQPQVSPFMKQCENNLAYLWCPSLKWGSYVPQRNVDEPTTTYGYNAWCLAPEVWGRRDSQNKPMPRKQAQDLTNPSELFVFADSGMFWSPAGVPIFQNSTSLDPPSLGAWGQNNTPTTHFRHRHRANALCADGHADSFGPDGGRITHPQYDLGFAGADNVPHYDQQ